MKSLKFKVTQGGWSTDRQLPAMESAETIIKAVGFDLDHCYGFYDNLKRHCYSEDLQ